MEVPPRNMKVTANPTYAGWCSSMLSSQGSLGSWPFSSHSVYSTISLAEVETSLRKTPPAIVKMKKVAKWYPRKMSSFISVQVNLTSGSRLMALVRINC